MSTKKQKRATETFQALVYCGPTIPGVAKQFTVYNRGIPATLEKKAENTPSIRSLVVPLDQLPDAMRQLREGTGSIYTLYCMVRKETNRR